MTTEPQTAPPSRRRRVIQRALIGVATVLLLYTLAGFLVLPWWIESYGVRMIGDRLQRPVAVTEAAFNPFKFTLELKDVSIREADNQPLASVGRIFVDLEPSAYLGGTATVRTVQIDQPEVFVRRMADGRINLAQLAPPADPEPGQEEEKGDPVEFLVADFTLDNGKVVFRDETAGGFETTASPIDVKVANLTNQVDQKAAYTLRLATGVGEGINLEGDLTLADAMATEGRLEISTVPLDHYAPYYKNLVGFEKAAGHADLAMAYRYADAQVIISDLAVTLAELILRHPADGEAFLTLPRLTVSGGRIDTRARTVAVQRIGLDGLTASARRAADGRIDLLDLLSPPVASAERPPAAAAPVEAKNPETPATAESNAPQWTVTIGAVQLGAGPLRFADPSARQPARAELGTLAVEMGDIAVVGPGVTVGRAELTAENITLKETGKETPLVQIPRLNVTGARLDTGRRQASVARVALRGTRVEALRRADGTVNLAGLFVPAAETTDTSGNETPAGASGSDAPAWAFDLGALVLEDHGLIFLDQVPAPDAEITVDQPALTVENFSTADGNRPAVDLACRINQAGTLSLNGEAALDPVASELAITLEGLPLKSFQPYLNDQMDLGITEGRLGAKGRLTLALPKDAPPRIHYQGGADISRFAAVDRRDNEDFLRWKSLFVEGADIATDPVKITVSRVALSDSYARVVITENGKLNAAQIFSPPDQAPASPPQQPRAAEKSAPLRLDVKEVTLQGGQVDFSDYFTRPNFQTRMVDLGGRVGGLSTRASTPAEVVIEGALENQSPLEISGKIDPFSQYKNTELKLTFRNIELSPFSPYSGKYLGYTLAKGKLTLELDYNIAERQLQARNRIFFDALTLGDRVESPDATSLPIKLALALLTDRQGRIELDVPVKGDLSDPQVSVFGIVLKALGNLLTKIVTSPFDALASAFGGQVVTHLDFDPGQSTLSPEDETRITDLADVLHERPALSLEIQGSADPQSDVPALRQQRFDALLRGVKRSTLGADQADVPLEEIEISEAERPEIIARAYAAAEFPKPRDEDGKEKILPPEEMEKLLFTQIQVNDNDLRQLAKARAAAVRDRLLADPRINAERVFLLEPKVEKTEDAEAGRRVKFGLR
jgi:hypothetical protein